MIFVNFKTYPQATGKNAQKMAVVCQRVFKKTGVKIIPCVQAIDLFKVCQQVTIPVWTQHIDPFVCGKTTGCTTAYAVKENGGKGTLINHSEHPLKWPEIVTAVALAKKRGLQIMVLVKDLATARKADQLKPDYIGLEEPALIGGKVAIVTCANQREKIKKFVKSLKNSRPLVGAGINKPSDIQASLKLGAKGVLLASAVVLSADPENTLTKLANAFVE